MLVDPGVSAATPVDVELAGRELTITRRSIAQLQLSHVRIEGPQTLRWTPAMIARCTRPTFVLIRMRAGHGWLHHRGGEIPLRADECMLLDGREPYEIALAGGSESLWLSLPYDRIEVCLPDPALAVAVPLGTLEPWGAMLCDVMDTIHADGGVSSPPLLVRNVCTALALAVGSIEVRSTSHSRKTFNSLQRTLADLASTCNVTVAEIAQAHGISPRYVHAIFSANGTSCGRELIRVRLERARRLLLDPAQKCRSIDELAWQCGFSDSGHFRRRFRATFGVPPSAMRGHHFAVAQRKIA